MAQRNSDWMGLASIGPHFAFSVIIGWLIGYKWLDPWLDTSPWFAILFLLLGVVAGFLNLYRELVRLNKREEDENEDK